MQNDRKKLPKISIVLPVYGVEYYIEDCVKSIMEQDYQGEIECLIVDDCTPDRSIELVSTLVEAYDGEIKFVFLQHKSNKGLSAARNTGLMAATGDYIFFCDSDDELSNSCISSLAHPLRWHDYEMVVGDFEVLGIENDYLPHLYCKDNTIFKDDDVKSSYYHSIWYPMVWGKLYKVESLKAHKIIFTEGLIHEDELWSAEIACTLKTIDIIKNKIYKYKCRPGSIMTSHAIERHNLALRRICGEFYNFLYTNGLQGNYWANSIFQNLIYKYISDTYSNTNTEYSNAYKYIKSLNSVSVRRIVMINQFWIGSIARDFHYLLNTREGANMYRIFNLRFYNKRYHNFLRRIFNRGFYHAIYN